MSEEEDRTEQKFSTLSRKSEQELKSYQSIMVDLKAKEHEFSCIHFMASRLTFFLDIAFFPFHKFYMDHGSLLCSKTFYIKQQNQMKIN